MAASKSLELQTLTVKIMMNANSFHQGTTKVIKGLQDMEAAVVNFAAKIGKSAVVGLGAFSKSLANLGTFLDSAAGFRPRHLDRLSAALPDLQAFCQLFADATKTLQTAPVAEASKALRQFGQALDSFRKYSDTPGKMTAIGNSLGGMLAAISAVNTSSANLPDISAVFGKIGAALSSMDKVETAKVGRVGRSLTNVLSKITGVDVSSAENLVQVMTKLSTMLKTFGDTEAKHIGSLNKSIGAFFDKLNVVGGKTSMTTMRDLMTVMRTTTQLMSSMNKLNPTEVGTIGTGINKLFTDLGATKIANPDELLKMLRGTSAVMKHMHDLKTINVDELGKSFVTFFTNLANADVSKAQPVINFISKMSTFLNNFKKVQWMSISPVAGQIKKMIDELNQIKDTAGAEKVATVLAAVARAMRALSVINQANLQGSINAMKRTISALNTMHITPNAIAAANALHQIGNMRGGGRFGGGGGGGNTPFSWFGNFNSNVNNASTALGRFVASMRYSLTMSNELAQGIDRVSLALSGMAMFGIKAFSELDDALIRSMMHARDFEQVTKIPLLNASRSASNASVNSATNMAKALDELTSSGMSAGMAIKALTYVEDFAVNANIKTYESAKKLTNIMNGLGLASTDVQKTYENMQALTDMIVGISHRVGSTEGQMVDSFVGRLMTSVNQTGIGLKETIALLGVLSRHGGDQFRGSTGGNILARSLQQIQEVSINNGGQWENILNPKRIPGEGMRDLQGRIKPVMELIQLLGTRLGGLDPTKYAAIMDELGFKDKTVLSGLGSIINHAKSLKELQVALNGVEGNSKRAADAIRESFLSQMQRFGNLMYNAAGVVGERLAPALKLVSNVVEFASVSFQKLNPAFQNLIVYGTLAAIAIKPMFMILGSITATIAGMIFTPFLMMYRTVMLAYSGVMLLWSGVRLLGSVFSVLWSAVYKVGEGLIYAFNNAYNILSGGLMIALNTLRSTLFIIGVVVYSLFTNLYGTLRDIGDILGSTLKAVWNMIVQIGTSLIMGLVTFALNFVSSLIMITLMLPIVVTMFAGIAAIVVTVGIGIGQLVALVGTGLVAAWNAFKQTAVDALNVAGRGVEHLHANIGTMWAGMKAGSAGFIQQLVTAFTIVAGFFWNFSENINKIWTWIGKYGSKAFEDVGTAVFKFAETVASAITRAITGSVGAVRTVFMTIFATIKAYFGAFSIWMQGNWGKVMVDMGSMFMLFLKNLSSNWSTLDPLFQNITAEATRKFFAWQPLSSDEHNMKRREEIGQYYAEKRATILNNIKFKGPLDGFNEIKFATKPSSFKAAMNLANMTSSGLWQSVMSDAAKAFGDAFIGINPLSKAFDGITKSPIWHELFQSLNVAIPDNAMEKMKEMYQSIFGKSNLLPEDTGNAAGGGKGGPGYQFKQIALERYMTGGTDLESLDYQQLTVLRSIDKQLQKLNEANRPNAQFKEPLAVLE